MKLGIYIPRVTSESTPIKDGGIGKDRYKSKTRKMQILRPGVHESKESTQAREIVQG